MSHITEKMLAAYYRRSYELEKLEGAYLMASTILKRWKEKVKNKREAEEIMNERFENGFF